MSSFEDLGEVKTDPCGCSIRKHSWEIDEDHPATEVWVQEELCAVHSAKQEATVAAIEKLESGEPLSEQDYEALENVYYVDVPLCE